jgi:hypothetical protein
MNDYYPFLVERISKLQRNGEGRRMVYRSAREELVTKLERAALRVPEAEIARERRALDAAIQNIEAEMERKGASDAAASDPTIQRTSSDSSVSSQSTRIESESTPTVFAGENGSETAAPTTRGIVELAATAEKQGEKSQPNRKLPDATPTPGAVVARAMRKQLTSMVIAIIVCCLVFAAIYFSKGIGESLGL